MKLKTQDEDYTSRLLKAASICIILASLIAAIHLGKEIIIPLLFGLIFAILLRPVAAFLNKKLRLPDPLAILITIILAMGFLALVVFFVASQIAKFAENFPDIKQNLIMHYQNIQDWINDRFGISYAKQRDYVNQITEEGSKEKGSMVANTLTSLTHGLVNLIVIPVLTFLILLYRKLLVRFIAKLIKRHQYEVLDEIIFEISIVVNRYLLGLLIEMSIVATLTWLGLMLMGVEHAILLGAMTGMLNVIPYVGIFIAGILSILIAVSTADDPNIILGVLLVNVVVQFLDNNIILPRIVGSKVSINALASIAGVITGGLIAGVEGMFLAIPVMAICKIIFDKIEALEPIGYLIGSEESVTHPHGKLAQRLVKRRQPKKEVKKKL